MKTKTSNLPRVLRVLCAILASTASRPGRVRGRHAAFTLLEMAIVLAILALVTHIAVVRLVDDTYKPRLARRQLDDIHAAICGKPGALDPAGQPTWTGFVADMGRLPVAIRDREGGPLTLGELWQCPDSDGIAFGPRCANAENLVKPDGTSAAPTDADPDVFVMGGWRGPYLRLPSGRTSLFDPWGNEYANGADASRAHLIDADGAVAQEGREIHAVVGFGSDGAPNWDKKTEAARDMTITNDIAATLTVTPYFTVSVTDENGSATFAQDDKEHSTVLRVYGPCGDKVMVASSGEQSIKSGHPITVGDLTPGPRVFRIQCDGVPCAVHSVILSPGDNTVSIRELFREKPEAGRSLEAQP